MKHTVVRHSQSHRPNRMGAKLPNAVLIPSLSLNYKCPCPTVSTSRCGKQRLNNGQWPAANPLFSQIGGQREMPAAAASYIVTCPKVTGLTPLQNRARGIRQQEDGYLGRSLRSR